MRLFRRKKGNQLVEPNTAPTWLRAIIGKVQEKWVQAMLRCTKNLSKQGWKVVLVIIIVSGNGYGVYMVAAGLSEEGKDLSLTRLARPIDSAATTKRHRLPKERPGKEYERLIQFKHEMDSLARSPKGRAIYDSITKSRPGIMDSLRIIEQYYSATNK